MAPRPGRPSWHTEKGWLKSHAKTWLELKEGVVGRESREYPGHGGARGNEPQRFPIGQNQNGHFRALLAIGEQNKKARR